MHRAVKSQVVSKYLDDAQALGIGPIVTLNALGNMVWIECSHPGVKGKIESTAKDWISAARELPTKIKEAIRYEKEVADKRASKADQHSPERILTHA